MKKIILISGKAQHGKDTSAEYIMDKLTKQGYKVAVDHFARPIKEILKTYYGWDGVNKNEYWRTLLQLVGTDKSKEELNLKNIWANRLCQDIQIIKDDFDYIIIPDCRFKSEVYFTKSYFPNDVISLRVSRLGFESPLTKEQQNHISETDLDDFSFDSVAYHQSLSSLYDELDRCLLKFDINLKEGVEQQ